MEEEAAGMTPVESEAPCVEHDPAGTAEHQGSIVPGPNSELLSHKSALLVTPGDGDTT